jgi:hypothetical protein
MLWYKKGLDVGEFYLLHNNTVYIRDILGNIRTDILLPKYTSNVVKAQAISVLQSNDYCVLGVEQNGSFREIPVNIAPQLLVQRLFASKTYLDWFTRPVQVGNSKGVQAMFVFNDATNLNLLLNQVIA